MSVFDTPLPSRLWDAVRELDRQSDASTVAEGAERVVAALAHHRLLPIAAESGAFSGSALAAIRQRCSSEHDARVAQTRLQEQVLHRALALVPPQSVIVIKGADLARRFYGRPELRPMNDVDLLVDQGMLDVSAAALRGARFQLCDGGGNESKFRDPETGVYVDLYERLIQRERVDIDYAAMRREAEIGWHGALSLRPEHALLTLALDLANLQYLTHLRKLIDLWLLTRDPHVVGAALRTAQTWRMRRAMFSSLHQLTLIAPELRGEPWYPELQQLVSARERRLLCGRVLPPTPVARSVGRVTRLRRKFALIDGSDQRLRFVAAHAWRRVATG